MKRDAMDENLVGYLLKALDADTQRDVEGFLRTHPEQRNRLELLRRALAPLASDPDSEPPANLWVRTLARVAEHECRKLPPAPQAPPTQSVAPSRRGWRWVDALVAAGILLCAVGLALPGVNYLWQQHAVSSCKNNLRLYYGSLMRYSDSHGGALPRIEAQGAKSVAGSFVPMLHDAGVLDADVTITCAAEPPRHPSELSVDDLEAIKQRRPEEFNDLARNLSGCYAYTLGYFQAGQLKGVTRDLDGRLPIMADTPPFRKGAVWPSGNSPNHGGRGQNVLFLDGSVEFRTARGVGPDGDDIYLNNNNLLAAGVGPRDAVLGPSWASPYPDPDDQ
jgi:prepilin-type processing-associated H-X9-DG protein